MTAFTGSDQYRRGHLISLRQTVHLRDAVRRLLSCLGSQARRRANDGQAKTNTGTSRTSRLAVKEQVHGIS